MTQKSQSVDDLISWLYLKRCGTLSQLTSVLNYWFDQPADENLEPRNWIRDIETLGYLEIDWQSKSWTAHGPSLVALGPTPLFALTGCRTQGIAEDIRSAAIVCGGKTIRQRQFAERKMSRPDAVFVAFEIGDAVNPTTLNMQFDMPILFDLQRNLSSNLIPFLLERMVARPQFGTRVERLRIENSHEWLRMPGTSWVRHCGEYTRGLYRWDLFGKQYRYFDGQQFFDVPGNLIGIYLCAAKSGQKDLLTFTETVGGVDETFGVLRAPLGANLPAHQRRIAVLSSGLLPQRGSRYWEYANVARANAEQIALSLGQDLRCLDE